MKKKLLIGIGIVVLVLVAAILFLNNRNLTLSPPGTAEATGGVLTVKVEYSRPSVRERMIFGEEEEGALLPYGVYWRLGANEPTSLEVSDDFMFGDTPIPAGKYVIYAFPRKGEMELVLNSDLRFWGYSEPNYDQDMATVVVPMNRGAKTEQFTIDATSDDSGATLAFSWDVYQWELSLKPQ